MFPKITSLPLGVPRPRMVGVLRGFDPDVVHLASPALLGYGGLHAARFLGIPTVAVFQTDVAGFAESYGIGVASRAAWAWTRHLHKRADRTLAPSTSAMENLAAHRIPRVHKWARGVDITGFAPSARDAELRRRWSPNGRPVVGFVGRLAPEKHVERLAALARRDDLQLVIVGDGVDQDKLKSAMPSAVFTGALYGEPLATAFASMDVFVHPGEHETFCQAVQEAMASGLPVIAPNAGGPRDLVAPYRTGLLLEVDEFEAKLGESVDHLIAERQRYSLAARRSVLAPDVARDLRRVDRPLRRRAGNPTTARRLALPGEQKLALRFDRDRLPLFPRLEAVLVIGLGQLQRHFTEEHPQRWLGGVDDLEQRAGRRLRIAGFGGALAADPLGFLVHLFVVRQRRWSASTTIRPSRWRTRQVRSASHGSRTARPPGPAPARSPRAPTSTRGRCRRSGMR